MRILHISDTHNAHRHLRELPEADVIVHSGDVSLFGSVEEVEDFINWFLDLPYRYKIFIAGNHDSCLLDAKISGLDANCFFLDNNGIEIEGVKFFGIPAFIEYSVTGEDEKYYSEIPADTDILISHQPPFGILDFSDGTNFGSHSLLKRVKEIKPKLHLFGHIHCAFGEKFIGKTTFVNSSLLDENYNLINAPRVVFL